MLHSQIARTMMKPLFSILAVSVCIAQSLPLSAQDKSGGKDVTPLEVQQKFYKWGKEEREDRSLQARLAHPSSQWLNRFTNPIDGFVILPSGERFVGKLVVHNRLTVEAERGRSTDPNADVIPDVSISHDGKTDKFELAAVAAFGAQFTTSDWTPKKKSKDLADSYHPGFVQLDNDVRNEGLVALSSSQEGVGDLRTFDRVYFAADASSPVEIYLTPRFGKPGVPNVLEAGQKGGNEASYHLLRGSLIDQGAWIARLERDPKKLQAESLMPADVLFHNGAVLKGRLGLQTGKSQQSAYLIDEDQDLLYLAAGPGIKVVNATEKSVTQQFVVLSGEFVNNQEATARFDKNESLHPGRIVLATGEEMVGRISLRRAQNMVKSYRIPLGAYFLPNADKALLSYFTPDQVEYLEEEAAGATTRYAPLENAFVPQDEYLAGLESSKSRIKTRNLQVGYVMLEDGTRLNGRIAQRNGAIVVVDASSRFKKYHPNDKGLSHFVQTIDGTERRFIPLQGGIRAFSGGVMEFVEVFGADKDFSYYRNPNPTHLKKFATKLAKGVINTATTAGRVVAANAAAKQEVRASLEGSDKGVGDVAGAVVAGAQAQQKVLEATEGIVEVGDEGGLYHKEWVVVNNTTKEKSVIYSGNDSQELTRLLSLCPKYRTLDQRDAKRLTNVGSLEAAVHFLNSCR
ncbi:MAG: hypothetical protein AABZ80_09585 [Gemmatimonadota bacterium]